MDPETYLIEIKVKKKKTWRLLAGRTWDDMPVIAGNERFKGSHVY